MAGDKFSNGRQFQSIIFYHCLWVTLSLRGNKLSPIKLQNRNNNVYRSNHMKVHIRTHMCVNQCQAHNVRIVNHPGGLCKTKVGPWAEPITPLCSTAQIFILFKFDYLTEFWWSFSYEELRCRFDWRCILIVLTVWKHWQRLFQFAIHHVSVSYFHTIVTMTT